LAEVVMQILRRPTFRESWRSAGPDERADLKFSLVLMAMVLLLMASSAAVIGALVVLVGGLKVGIGVAAALVVIAALNLFRE